MSSILSAITLPEQLTLSYAIGRAAGGALEPLLIDLVNAANRGAVALGESRPLSLGEAAAVAAQRPTVYDRMAAEAEMRGYDATRFADTYGVLLTAPGMGELLAALRRGTISDGDFTHALRKHRLEAQWDDPLRDLRNARLEPVQIANAIHRGLIPDPGLLAVAPPTGTGNVPAYPVYDLDPLAEAKAWGVDRERLGALVGLTGLPMGPHEAAQAVFRNILTQTDFQRAVAQSNTRNEWGEAIFEQSRQIPTARDFLENALRGYRTLAAALAGAELHGMTPEHATMLYQNQGRPMNIRLITQALARGGTFQPEPGEITDPYRASIVEGNLKPGYYDLAEHLKYTMPSVFAIRALAQAGVWDEAKTEQRLLWLGWYPPDAKEVAQAWSGGTTGGVDAHVGKAQTQLWNTAHTSYKSGEIDDGAVTATLPSAGVDQAAIPAILDIWRTERALVRATLSAADIRKAYQHTVINLATGAAWTDQEAIDALMARGWDPQEAAQYLDIS